jgi:hypothetical protein
MVDRKEASVLAPIDMLVLDQNVELQNSMQLSLSRSLSADKLEGGMRMSLHRLLYVCTLPHEAIVYSSGIIQEEYQDDSILEPCSSTHGPPCLRINYNPVLLQHQI